ncbi:hypothetical protein SCP_2000050 [Sparassis crispa]|uniref:Uncharacterized protein n=1 Tax=Sparassis crispa TaxID=139825 RepID=A0A401H779_9APHY|nr:hypothetical protein SCP_2000050 [Sparassis crispa]GBE90262.1 hypothetical protein SCP_2000050 [Sparassis crispa]
MNGTIALRGRHYKTVRSIFQAQGSVGWRELVEAFQSMSFKVKATKGSVHKFSPPSTIPGRAFTWHKPHSSQLRPDHLRILRGDLSQLYHWRVETFIRKK